MKALTFAAVITLLSSCVSHQHGSELPPLQTVAQVDLNRYVGLWYEIGRYPNGFQKGCLGEVVDDEEGMKNMHLLGENMPWLLKKIKV